MSLSIYMTDQDKAFVRKLNESSLSILASDKKSWSCEEIIRFLSLIKVQSKLETLFYEFPIGGEQMFQLKYLFKNLSPYLEPKNYFPIMKLLYVVNQTNALEFNQEVNQCIPFSSLDSAENGSQERCRLQQMTKGLKSKAKASFKIMQAKSSPREYEKSPEKSGHQSKSPSSNSHEEIQLIIDIEEGDANDSKGSPSGVTHVQGECIRLVSSQLHKISNIPILELSVLQMSRLFKNTQNPDLIKLAELIKEFSIDGYCLMLLFSERSNCLYNFNSYFSAEEIEQIEAIYNILLPLYYSQIDQDLNQKTSLKGEKNSNTESDNQLLTNIDYQSLKKQIQLSNQAYQNLGNPETVKNSVKNSTYGTSQYGTSEYGSSSIGHSESDYGVSESQGQISMVSEIGEEKRQSQARNSMRESLSRSVYGESVYAESEYGQSEYAQSEYANSEYAVSERGSVRNSFAESIFGDNVTYKESTNKKQNVKNVRISSIEDTSAVQKLQEVAMDLPFNLFKMDPIQRIRITPIGYPFHVEMKKPKSHKEFVYMIKNNIQKLRDISSTTLPSSKDFNITGAKFGRGHENDFKYTFLKDRYPDELSISGKHAQVCFCQESYKIMDLGSKTGTFLYIPLTRPWVLQDEQIIQLSNQIEIVVHILKQDELDGVIKLEFTKPEKEPFYKACLKEGQTLRIGRSEKAHIKLQQQSISSKHTEIRYEGKQFKIYDCLSEAGTWLRLSKKGNKSPLFPLVEGDILRISSKRTYVIEMIKSSLAKKNSTIDFLDLGFDQKKDLAVISENGSEEDFEKIIEKTLMRKNPYQKSKDYVLAKENLTEP